MTLSLEILKARIGSARTLRSIVRTMKILAAVGARQDEKARESLAAYARTIELGLQVALRALGGNPGRLGNLGSATGAPASATMAIVLGSDMGMCGQFNEKIASFAAAELGGVPTGNLSVLAVGERVAMRLEDLGIAPFAKVPCPGNSATGVANSIREVLGHLDAWRGSGKGEDVLLFHSSRAGRSLESECRKRRLLPVDEDYLAEIEGRPWKSRSLPFFRMDGIELLHACLRGTVYTLLYRAFIDSLECENAARLEAMEAAERHIDEHLGELRAAYNEARQESITSELLDIIAGVEAADPSG